MKDINKSLHKTIYALISFIVIAGTILSCVPPKVNAEETKVFKDVKSTHYFYEAVYDLKSRGIIDGYEDQTFRPHQYLTRAAAAKIIALTLGLNTKDAENPGFKDVKPTDPYYKYIAALAKAGIFTGYENKTFKPQQFITRAQIAKILSLGFELGEETLTNNPFTDVRKDAWYTKFLPSLIANEITTGTTPTTFSPNSNVTRGQFAAFIYRSEMAINRSLIGRVSIGSPVSQAKISVFKSNGEQIFENEQLVTDEYGTIHWESVEKELPSNFRVVIEGGYVDGVAFSGKLMADFQNFNRKNDIIYVNAVTTMISEYTNKHPDATLKEAEQAIMTFLDIPEWNYSPSAMHISGESFNYERFLNEAASNGGINSFIHQLIVELDNGKTHSFSQEILKGAVSFIASNLAKSALSYAGGELAGWGLRSLGVNFEEEDRTPQELERINKGLDDMKHQLNGMSTQLDGISSKMDNIRDELDKLSQKIDVNTYQLKFSNMSTLLANVESISDRLTKLVEDSPDNYEKQKDRLLTDIDRHILNQDNVIHMQLTKSSGGQKPLLTLWKDIHYKDRFLTKEDYDFIEAQFEYFKQIQEHMLLLEVEYYHAIETKEGENLYDIEQAIDRFNKHMEIQLQMIPDPIADNIIVDKKENTMYYAKDVKIEITDNVSLKQKSKSQIVSDMQALVQSNPGDFTNWRPFPASHLYKITGNTITNFTGPDYLIDNGWPGMKVPGVVIPFIDDYTGKTDTDLLYFLSHNRNNLIRMYPVDGFDFEDKSVFPLIMISREITEEEYLY